MDITPIATDIPPECLCHPCRRWNPGMNQTMARLRSPARGLTFSELHLQEHMNFQAAKGIRDDAKDLPSNECANMNRSRNSSPKKIPSTCWKVWFCHFSNPYKSLLKYVHSIIRWCSFYPFYDLGSLPVPNPNQRNPVSPSENGFMEPFILDFCLLKMLGTSEPKKYLKWYVVVHVDECHGRIRKKKKSKWYNMRFGKLWFFTPSFSEKYQDYLDVPGI